MPSIVTRGMAHQGGTMCTRGYGSSAIVHVFKKCLGSALPFTGESV
jgi:hypothetical protein